MARLASCHCGDVAVSCTGEPVKVSLCHCFDCQRRTGSLFSVAAFFPRDQVRETGAPTATYARTAASGFAVTFHFCPNCGTNVWWEPQRMPHLVGVAAGAFADPAFPMPEQAVWANERHTWLDLPAAIPSHAENPVRPPAE